MKTFCKQAAQGDVLITKIAKLPDGLKPTSAVDGRFIVAHSETGHSHIVAERPGIQFYEGLDPLVAYLQVIDAVEVTLEHERTFDTHEALLIPGGTYEIRRQQEYTPEGWRRVAD